VQHASVVSLAAASGYYGHPAAEQSVGVGHGGHGGHSPGKYQENGHDTFSDFVTLVCQEAQNTQNAQVAYFSFRSREFLPEPRQRHLSAGVVNVWVFYFVGRFFAEFAD